MTSKRQQASNRLNAKKSTGPKTDQGRLKSAQNARKHGLYAEHFILDVESREAYELFHAQLLEDHQPQTAVEVILIEEIATSYFISRRVLCALADVSNRREVSGTTMSEKYPPLMRIKNSADRTIQRCIEQLRVIATERARNQPDPPLRPLLEDPDILHKWLPLEGTGFVPAIAAHPPESLHCHPSKTPPARRN